MRIKFNDLFQQWNIISNDVNIRLNTLFENSAYINGKDVNIFEQNFADYIGTKYCIGTSNGTDAIKLCIRALNIQSNTKNDLILIPANTFIATYLGAKQGNPTATIKLIDCDDYYQIDVELLEEEIANNRHKYDNCIILGVHLYGHCCDVENILRICETYHCIFVEDSAQAHGTLTAYGKTGSIGMLGAFSFYPGKNLGACGDAGCVTTNDKNLYDIIKSLRNLGTSIDKYHYDYEGYNNRLDTIQAIILDEKLKHLNEWNKQREKIALTYNNHLSNIIKCPQIATYCKKHTYHLYVIRYKDRYNLAQYLHNNNIETGIHYPIPIEETSIYQQGIINHKTVSFAKTLLSLPIHPFMTEDDTRLVCKLINQYVTL